MNLINQNNFDSIKSNNLSFQSLNNPNSIIKKISHLNRKKNLVNFNNNNEDIKKINLLINKIKDNNQQILIPLEEIKNEKEKKLKIFKYNNKNIEKKKRRNMEEKLGILDYLDTSEEYEISAYENYDIEKPKKESIFNKLVNLTNFNSSNNKILENNNSNSNSFSKLKLVKRDLNKKKFDKEVEIKDYNSNNSNKNNKKLFDNLNSNSKRNYSYSELNPRFEKRKNNIFNKSKNTISNSKNNDLYFDFENKIKKKEKLIRDKFYEKAEIKTDYFGLRGSNNGNYSKDKSIQIDNSQKSIYYTERNISNPKSSFKYNSNDNLININIKERELPYNFIMPVNPMNDVISAKVNYLYGNKK